MKRARALSAALLLAFTLNSCSEPVSGPAPATPPPAPDMSLLGTLLQTTGLLTCSPLPYASATETVGPNGGVIEVGPHRLYIPPGALDEAVRITAVTPSGRVNQVQFQPEGLRFQVPAALTMSYANCNLLGKLLPKRIAYVDGNLRILEYILSLDILSLRKVTGSVNHFSAYAVAW